MLSWSPLLLPAVSWAPFPARSTIPAGLSAGTPRHHLHHLPFGCQVPGLLFCGLASSRNSGWSLNAIVCCVCPPPTPSTSVLSLPSAHAQGLGAPWVPPVLPPPAPPPPPGPPPPGSQWCHLPAHPRGLAAPLQPWCSLASSRPIKVLIAAKWGLCLPCLCPQRRAGAQQTRGARHMSLSEWRGHRQGMKQTQLYPGGVCQAPTPLRPAQVLEGRSKWYLRLPPGPSGPDHP